MTAPLLAPAFLLVAISGGLYLTGNKGEFKSTPVTLPASASLDFKSPTLEQDVRDLLKTANIDHKFEYVRNRGTVIQLRPTSRTYLEFRQTDTGLTALYQKAVALGLIGVVFGGILVGLLAKAYRRQTIIAVVVGSIIFFILAFFV